MCTVLLPPGVNPIAVNKYIYPSKKALLQGAAVVRAVQNCQKCMNAETHRFVVTASGSCLLLPDSSRVYSVQLFEITTSRMFGINLSACEKCV
jgi:hypothetical protein